MTAVAQSELFDYKRTVEARYKQELEELTTANEELLEANKALQSKLDAVRQTCDSTSTAQAIDERPLPTHRIFEHLHASRENYTHETHVEKNTYTQGQVKVFPNKYGSNQYWDLGLCQLYFRTRQSCRTPGCEYRHHTLTENERRYIRRLKPKGPDFLLELATFDGQEGKKL